MKQDWKTLATLTSMRALKRNFKPEDFPELLSLAKIIEPATVDLRMG